MVGLAGAVSEPVVEMADLDWTVSDSAQMISRLGTDAERLNSDGESIGGTLVGGTGEGRRGRVLGDRTVRGERR
jgi:hypothetical protein